MCPLAISESAGAEMSLNKPMNKVENWLMNSGGILEEATGGRHLVSDAGAGFFIRL